MRLIIGARGERRALRIVAEHADEWNVTRVTLTEFAAKRAAREEHCRAIGRTPEAIRCSLMVPFIIGRTPDELRGRSERARAIFPRLPEEEVGWRSAGFLYGSPAAVTAELGRWRDAGIARVMLQMIDQEDLAAIDLIGRKVMPAFRHQAP